jgi:hypothetical protein
MASRAVRGLITARTWRPRPKRVWTHSTVACATTVIGALMDGALSEAPAPIWAHARWRQEDDRSSRPRWNNQSMRHREQRKKTDFCVIEL